MKDISLGQTFCEINSHPLHILIKRIQRRITEKIFIERAPILSVI